MPDIVETKCTKVGEKLRRPALHEILLLCARKSDWMAPPDALTDSYTRFLPKAQPYLKSKTRTSKSTPYIIELPKYTLSYYIGG